MWAYKQNKRYVSVRCESKTDTKIVVQIGKLISREEAISDNTNRRIVNLGPGEAASGADLGGSSKYSNDENILSAPNH